jgi:hypothetical protein
MGWYRRIHSAKEKSSAMKGASASMDLILLGLMPRGCCMLLAKIVQRIPLSATAPRNFQGLHHRDALPAFARRSWAGARGNWRELNAVKTQIAIPSPVPAAFAFLVPRVMAAALPMQIAIPPPARFLHASTDAIPVGRLTAGTVFLKQRGKIAERERGMTKSVMTGIK